VDVAIGPSFEIGSIVFGIGSIFSHAGAGKVGEPIIRCDANSPALQNLTIAGGQSGRCLDVSQNSSADGQQIHIWDCLGAANQKWVLP